MEHHEVITAYEALEQRFRNLQEFVGFDTANGRRLIVRSPVPFRHYVVLDQGLKLVMIDDKWTTNDPWKLILSYWVTGSIPIVKLKFFDNKFQAIAWLMGESGNG